MTLALAVAGVSIPRIGLGTYLLTGETCVRAVAAGLAMGYRHVDTAEMYDNEAEVGEGLRAAALPREEVFVTSKVWPSHIQDGDLQRTAEGALERLGLEYLDLYLIHWPNPDVPVAESIRALCEVKRRGLARAIGVSNFPVALLDEAVARADEPLAVNQVEYHPYLDQGPVLSAVERHRMALTAYCPIARGKVMDDPVIRAIAERHGVTPVQVTLAWLIAQERVIAIPKSGSEARMRENLDARDVRLSGEERAAIDRLRSKEGRIIRPAFGPAWDE